MLKESPTAFGSDYEQAAAQPDSHFQDRTHDDPDNFIMAAWQEDELIGTAGGLHDTDNKRRHIGTIWGMYVLPAYRRRGLGDTLLKAALERLQQLPELELIQLSVTVGNASALKLYEHAGFEIYGREPSALKVDGVDYDEFHLSLRLH